MSNLVEQPYCFTHTMTDSVRGFVWKGDLGFTNSVISGLLLICSYAGFICLVDGPLAYTIFNQLHVVTCL